MKRSRSNPKRKNKLKNLFLKLEIFQLRLLAMKVAKEKEEDTIISLSVREGMSVASGSMIMQTKER